MFQKICNAPLLRHNFYNPVKHNLNGQIRGEIGRVLSMQSEIGQKIDYDYEIFCTGL